MADRRALEEIVAIGRARVLDHPVLSLAGADVESLRVFMEHHVWAVWDFMSLLTKLQRELTCVHVPWVPGRGSPLAQRFVNEIKLAEESDVKGTSWASHFELYLDAMREVGADLVPVCEAVAHLRADPTLLPVHAAEEAGAPSGALPFVRSTFALMVDGPISVAAAFAYGREQLIPDMFRPLLAGCQGEKLLDYLERHIELDEGVHGPMARALVTELAEAAPTGWLHAIHGAQRALDARRRLWDATATAIRSRSRLYV